MDRLKTERSRGVKVRFVVVDEHALRCLDPHLFKGVSKGLGVRLFCAYFGRIDDFLEKAGNAEFMFENALDPGSIIGERVVAEAGIGPYPVSKFLVKDFGRVNGREKRAPLVVTKDGLDIALVFFEEELRRNGFVSGGCVEVQVETLSDPIFRDIVKRGKFPDGFLGILNNENPSKIEEKRLNIAWHNRATSLF